jgi:hypothetical protein
LRVYPSGRKAFVLSYRFSGRKKLYTIGDFGVYTPDQARFVTPEELPRLWAAIEEEPNIYISGFFSCSACYSERAEAKY